MSRAVKVSANLFYEVVDAAWDELDSSTQQTIRQTSKQGRSLHDSHITDLVVRLGPGQPDVLDHDADDSDDDESPGSEDAVATEPPSPSELRSTLAALVTRGAHLQTLRVRFLKSEQGHRPVGERESQLMAVLEALPGAPVSTLVLYGGVPLSGAVASAVASSFKCLTDVRFDFRWGENDLPHGAPDGDGASEYYYGAMKLLALCGPRLTGLRLNGGVQQWPMLAFQALRECTALTRLELDAGRKETDGCHKNGPYLGSPTHEDSILASIAQLPSLRVLRLRTALDPALCKPDALAPYATSPTRLSALTGLTWLMLDLSPCYEHHGDSWQQRCKEGGHHESWCEVREQHRASLLSTVRCMQQLKHLDCTTLWLQPSEGATLTALTSLSVGGLLPPALDGSSSNGSAVTLPPRLQTLALDAVVSPRALANLQIPESLTALDAWGLGFGMSDIEAGNRLRPDAVEAVGPAMRLIKDLRSDKPAWCNLSVQADGASGLLQPRAGVPDSHVEWLGHLSGFPGTELELHGLSLQYEDVCCLALLRVQGLKLVDSFFRAAALPSLLGMAALEELHLDLSRLTKLQRATLEAALLALCSQARKLRRVSCTRCALPNPPEIEAAIRGLLQARGKNDIKLTITAG